MTICVFTEALKAPLDKWSNCDVNPSEFEKNHLCNHKSRSFQGKLCKEESGFNLLFRVPA